MQNKSSCISYPVNSVETSYNPFGNPREPGGPYNPRPRIVSAMPCPANDGSPAPSPAKTCCK